MTKTALIIGGTGQIGWATAERLVEHGWDVTVASRNEGEAASGARSIALDREDDDHVRLEADGMDLVVDTVAYTPAHGEQLATLAGSVGSLVVISTASVYTDEQQRYFDIMEGPEDFPAYPVPVTEDQPTIDNAEQTYSPLKAAMERVLLATPGLPVSIVRPGAIHGPHSPFPREWFFVKRALDGRPHAVLAYDGDSVFGTTATANIAELARLCGEQPGVRALNAADLDPPTAREIGETVFRLMAHDARIVGRWTSPGSSSDTSRS
jgi:nucleoside-diphosphate-sugar epimerase